MAKIITMDFYGKGGGVAWPYFVALDGDLQQVRIADLTDEGGTVINAGGYGSGRPLINEHLPTRARRLAGSIKTHPKLDCHSFFSRFIVTDKVRQIIERFEPGIHQFFPITVTQSKKDHEYGDYFILHVCQRFDGLDPVRAQPRNHRGCLVEGADGTRKLILSRDRIKGYHLWHEKNVALGISGAFMSDELFDALCQAGVTGLRGTEVPEV